MANAYTQLSLRPSGISRNFVQSSRHLLDTRQIRLFFSVGRDTIRRRLELPESGKHEQMRATRVDIVAAWPVNTRLISRLFVYTITAITRSARSIGDPEHPGNTARNWVDL